MNQPPQTNSSSFSLAPARRYMTGTFYATGRQGAGNLLLGMVLGNFAIQVVLAFFQSVGLKKDRWKTFFTEMLYVFTFVKPGVDAYRLASGFDPLPGQVMDAVMESTFSRAIEMVFEGVPGLILQLMQMIADPTTATTAAIASAAISACSVALTATTIFWDIDTSPGMRKRNPEWCVPCHPSQVLQPNHNL